MLCIIAVVIMLELLIFARDNVVGKNRTILVSITSVCSCLLGIIDSIERQLNVKKERIEKLFYLPSRTDKK